MADRIKPGQWASFLQSFLLMLRLGTLSLFLTFSLSAQALTATQAFQRALRSQAEYLTQLPPVSPNRACTLRYERLWKDNVLDMALFYGYLNARGGAVMDRLMREVMVGELTRRCKNGLQGACGFKVLNDQSSSLGPIVLQRSLDQKNKVRIAIWNSTWKDFNDENTFGIGKVFFARKEQAEKTKFVSKAFLKAIQESEVVIYDGHSRTGTGPSFGPFGVSQLVTGALAKTNWRKVTYALQTAKKKPEVMMFASCVSQDYYLPQLRKLSPNMAIAGNEHSQSLGTNEQMVFSFIDSLVTGRCEDEINRSLLAPSKVAMDGRMKLFNFDLN